MDIKVGWYKLYKIAQAGYGSWIDSSGEVILVDGFQQHNKIAMELLREKHGLTQDDLNAFFDIYDKMMRLGYARIIYDQLNIETYSMTVQQRKRFMGLINSSNSDFITIDIKYMAKAFTDKVSARRYIMEQPLS